MNGYWSDMLEGGFNITLFYLDGTLGVTAYKYQTSKEELKQLGIEELDDSAIVSNQTTTSTTTNTVKTSNATTGQKKGQNKKK